MDKAAIRSLMKQKRLLYTKETFLRWSHQILQKVLEHPIYQKSQTIGIYVSLPQEVETLNLIQKALPHKRVCVPKVEGDIMRFYEICSLDDVQEGHFHVLEPTTKTLVEAKDIDLMIIPMLAFDDNLYRVGYGKGFYDKYLTSGFCGYKLGLAFAFQRVDHIAYDCYDQQLDEVIIND